MLKNFRGCMAGVLVGDCLGVPYEGDIAVNKKQLQTYFDKIEGPPFKTPLYKYSDDTSMTKSVALSLIENNGFSAEHLASKFVSDYFDSPNRGYGTNVVKVFERLNNENLQDVWKPAKDQFAGSGSYGNGGAMRIAPVSLFYYDNIDVIFEIGKKVTEITHTNPLGINGALVQAVIIYQCLLAVEKNLKLDTDNFISDLLKFCDTIENNNKRLVQYDVSYRQQIEKVAQLLKKVDVGTNEVVQKLGNSTSAIYSVPTALYCFLRGRENPIPEIETDNPFRRIIQYAISFGGDTDTIASMAGAIAGSYFGIDAINENMRKLCEDAENVDKIAVRLYEKSSSSKT